MPLQLVITPVSRTVAVTEGAQAMFTVSLSRAPGAPLSVAVASADRTIATAAPATLMFNATNYATAQTVVVMGVDDADTQADSTMVSLSAAGVEGVGVRVDVTDDDVQSIITIPTLITIAEGMTGRFDVRLAFAPTANVTVNVASAMTGKATVAPASVTFTPSNFATAQAIVVTTLQDPDVVDDVVNVTLSSTGLAGVSVPVTIVDDDQQGITVSTGALMVNEGGAPAMFGVHLNQAPSSSVTVNVTSLGTTAATATPATLTFTPTNYLTAQVVTVLGINDTNTTNDTAIVEVTSAGLTTRAVAVSVLDDDTQAIVVAPTSVSVAEGGTSTFTVRLAFSPGASVPVNIATSDATKATTTATLLTFDAVNYATPQVVTVNGIQDDDLAQDSATLTLSSPAVAVNVTVPVTITDDDAQLLVVTPTNLGVVEGATAPFTVRLAFRPAGNVTVTATSGSPLVASATPGTLAFTPANYAVPQSVTVAGLQDVNLTDGTSVVTVASTGLTPVPVNVSVTDDDRQAIFVSPGNLTVTEGAAPGTLQVRLNFAPTASTTVNIVSSGPAAATPATLTFTAADFATAQTVTVTPGSDADAVNETVTLTFSAAGITSTTLEVTVIDDDVQLHVVAPQALTVLEQAPAGAMFNVHLAAQPLADVTVVVASSAPGSLSASPATLTFTPGNYTQDQPVTVRGLSDPNLTDEMVNVTISSPVAPTVSVVVRVQEDDLQDLVVTPAAAVQPADGSLVVLEDAEKPATVGISLQFQPEGSKGVRVQSNNASVLINGLPFVDLLFTTTTYSIPQEVTVTTPGDNNLDQPADTTITIGLCGTACGSTVFAAIKVVNVDTRDDDTQRIITSVSTLPISENAVAGGSFTVQLAFEPLAGATETVTVTSSDTGAATFVPETLTFNAGNYNLPQTVSVTGVNDADVNNEVVTATLHSGIGGTANVTVVVSVTDDDTQNLILNSNSATIDELGSNTATFTVQPQFDPSGTLTVDLASPDTGAVTVSPSTLTFTTANYLTPQTVTVTSVSDEDVRDETVVTTVSAAGLQGVTFTVTVLDDDMQGLVAPSRLNVNEEGTTTLPVHLAFQPTVDLTVTPSIIGTQGKATVSGPLTFSPASYATDQLVTVTGLADEDLDDINVGLFLQVTSAQGSFSPEGAGAATTSLNVIDNDVQSILVSWQPPAPFVNSVQENGPAGSFQVHLAFPPREGSGDVVVASFPPGLQGHAGFVGTNTLTFNTGNFATNQTIRFRAIGDGDTLDNTGDVTLTLDESADVSGPNANVIAGVPVRLMDLGDGIVTDTTYTGLFGGTQFTERANIQWGTTSLLVTGHSPAGVFSVARDDRDLQNFAVGPTVGTASADNSTQSIEWNGSNFGVFVTDGGAIRYTQVSPALTIVGAPVTFAAGASQFWVTHNPSAQRYGVLFRTVDSSLSFSLVQYDGTVSSAQIVTSPDGIPDQTPSVHYVGGANGIDYSFNGTITPYVGLYTTSGGLVCLRLAGTGALPSGGSIGVNPNADFYSSVWFGALAAAHHQGTAGLDLEIYNLPSNGAPCTSVEHVRALGPDVYINPPSIASNGVDLAVAYDVQRIIDPIAGTVASYVGVFIYNLGDTTLSSNRLFNAPGDVPGERPSVTWAGDRWILRYATAAGVRVLAGSLIGSGIP